MFSAKTLSKNILFLFTFFGVILSCNKPPGPGGKASIRGKVYAKDFNSSATAVISEYYAAGENVYICYGNNTAVANNVKTSTDGSFEFLYLRTGHYKIFVLSKDTSIHVAGSSKNEAVEVGVDISSRKQTVILNDLVINN